MDQKNNNTKTRRKSSIDLGNMVFGKVPPQSKELEETILGAIMLERDAYERAAEILHAGVFYVESHQRMFRAMTSLYEKKMPIDLLTVVEELKSNEDLEFIGGPYYVSKLTNSVVSAANIDAHCRIVMQKYLARELIRIGGEMIAMGYEDSSDVFDILDHADDNISALRMNNIKKTFKRIQTVMTENLKKLEELRHRDEAITGVPTGFDDLDFVTSGWQSTDLIILAARPSVGKTAFSLSLAKNAAKAYLLKHQQEKVKQQAVGFFSLEMGDRQLVDRVLSSESGVWMWRFKNGKLENDHMTSIYKSADAINKLEILLDDTPGMSIQEFKIKAKVMVKKHDVGLIIVDYLQLMTDPTRNQREQEISSISRGLKGCAKELNIPIIALSQLSREFGKNRTGGITPQLSDLRESGAIEQDADVVMFLYRPSEAEITEDPELISNFYASIEKHRNGASPVKFIGKFIKETQSHRYLKVIDGSTMQPLGEQWQPIATVPAPAAAPSIEDKPADTNWMFVDKGSKMNKRDFETDEDDLPF